MEERNCICNTCGAEGVTTQPDPVWCPGCMEKRLKPGQRLATCGVCGAKGIEDANDLFPGICPDCLERSLYGEGAAA